MSQISKAIEWTDTGERKLIRTKLSPLFEQMVDTKASWETTKDYNVLKQYRIQLTLRNTFTVSELEVLKNNDALKEAVDRAKKQMIEAVFGEFRPYIRRLEQAIYDYNMEEAGNILQDMENVMFGYKDQ
jgi:hypothetical protein